MALKDWKKYGERAWKKNWDGRIRDTIYIDRTLVPISYFGTKEELRYGVHIGYESIDGSKVVDRSEHFRTKSAAIKFAKDYMSKH